MGKFYPPHAGHHALVRATAARCARVSVVVAPARRESIPLADRLAWLREEHADTPWVRFVGRYDDRPVDYADPAAWDAHCAVFREAVGADPVDAVFSSETYGEELARRFAAVPVCVDLRRRAVPVSGTGVRADPVGHRRWLGPAVRAWFVRRVVVVGAESTGTTTMAAALAAHYDTDTRATGGWEERYLGSASAQVRAAARRPALYLLTDHVGVPFDDDGLRDGAHLRGWMTERFRAELVDSGVPVVELSGAHPQWLSRAVAACDELLAAGWSLADPLVDPTEAATST
ncbi:AAA family ATPase [Micromonospora radicis]|uniref:Transcriptional regulator n=1 Tax=Micromonospora radicis TaxID=1894971 RepID=A0A418MS98_9ACTN|nr:AAA family ATPase [Micromonospora radicis]RIV36919.1 transcriptional regulator [Micromonospora radicis]